MIKAHRNAISKFQHEANNGNVQDVKSFGSLTVPTLKQHLQRAQDIAGTSGSAARTNTRKRR
jgi:putative membrane protein